MWHLKRTIISVLGIQEKIKNTFTHIKKIPGNLSLSEIKKDFVSEYCSFNPILFNNFLKKTFVYLAFQVKDLVNECIKSRNDDDDNNKQYK